MKPYDNIAYIYDELQKDIDYNIWTTWVAKYPKSTRILELGSGTGTLANILDLQGYDIVGSDLSTEMIKYASKKNENINFLEIDICGFNLEQKYDLIIVFMDTINYILGEKDLKKAFSNMYKHLNKGGRLLFDIHKLDNLDNFDNYMEAGKINGTEFLWHSRKIKSNIVNHHFVIDGITEEHHQEIQPLKYYQKIYKKKFTEVSVSTDDYRFYITLEKE